MNHQVKGWGWESILLATYKRIKKLLFLLWKCVSNPDLRKMISQEDLCECRHLTAAVLSLVAARHPKQVTGGSSWFQFLPSLCPIVDEGVLSNGCCGGHGLSVQNLSLARTGGLLVLELTALGSCYAAMRWSPKLHQFHCKFLLVHPAGLIGWCKTCRAAAPFPSW